jgi:hypothetical protein
MTYQDDFDRAASEVLARVAAGENLSLKLAQRVVDKLGSSAPPGAVLFVAAGLLSERVRTERLAAG